MYWAPLRRPNVTPCIGPGGLSQMNCPGFSLGGRSPFRVSWGARGPRLGRVRTLPSGSPYMPTPIWMAPGGSVRTGRRLVIITDCKLYRDSKPVLSACQAHVSRVLCRSGGSFVAFSIACGLSRIFAASSRLRAHPTLVLSETKPHHFTGTIIPFSSRPRTKRSPGLSTVRELPKRD